jgi:gluconate 5-dehydrogenase/2-deoxy-D-gluconate 3-dehydrogenase
MVLESLSLAGKVAIVTGGGGGLGTAMSLAMAKAGADIVIADKRLPAAELTAERVNALGRKALAIATDVTDSRQVNDMADRTFAEFGKVDILVNNAGLDVAFKPITEITDEEWRHGMDTNLSGAFYCSRAAVKFMQAQKSGKIINIASGFGFRGGRNYFIYSAAKAGVISLTQTLALSLAEDNIQVNCIAPGLFWTFQTRGDAAQIEEAKRMRGRFIPMGRVGEPEELGPICVFLASDASSYMTGAVISPDGGSLASGFAPTGIAPIIPL